jgi:D-3-phosphoglycerate dehydrogenase
MAEIWIPDFVYKFKDAGWEVRVSTADPPLSPEDFLADSAGITAIMANGSDIISREVIESSNNSLKVISRTGVGFDKVDILAAKEHNIVVTTTPGANGETVADFTFGLILACSRQIPQLNKSLKNAEWNSLKGNDVFGKTIGIAGLGRIGQSVARRAAAFSMEILGYDPYIDATSMGMLGIRKVTFDVLLSTSDFVTLHMPANQETTGMINRETLAIMKNSAFLINTARGALVDETALLDALEARMIAGAGLDVFVDEPQTQSPLFELENAIVSPHIAGNTKESMSRMAEAAVDNVLAVSSGKWPRDIVVNGVYSD